MSATLMSQNIAAWPQFSYYLWFKQFNNMTWCSYVGTSGTIVPTYQTTQPSTQDHNFYNYYRELLGSRSNNSTYNFIVTVLRYASVSVWRSLFQNCGLNIFGNCAASINNIPRILPTVQEHCCSIPWQNFNFSLRVKDGVLDLTVPALCCIV
jgi:hypothetical protein